MVEYGQHTNHGIVKPTRCGITMNKALTWGLLGIVELNWLVIVVDIHLRLWYAKVNIREEDLQLTGQTKICINCGRTKPLSQFQLKAAYLRKPGLEHANTCKVCNKLASLKGRQRNGYR